MKTAIFALALAMCGTAYAQPGGMQGKVTVKSPEERQEMMRERIESRKVAYITDKLELTPAEAQTFWPVYNEYKAQKEALRDEDRGYGRMGRYAQEADVENEEEEEKPLTAEELDERMSARFDRERKRIDLDEKYYAKYKTVLPAEKVEALYRAERSFKREMMRSMRDGRGKGNRERTGRGDLPQREAR